MDGDVLDRFRHATPRAQRTAVGLVFQQPRVAVNPRFTLRGIIAEPLHAGGDRGAAAAQALARQAG